MSAGRRQLVAVAEALGAVVYYGEGADDASTGNRWRIMHYGVGAVVPDCDLEPGFSSPWDALGRLLFVATMPVAMGGHGLTYATARELVTVPHGWSKEGLLMLPGGIDGTTDAVLARVVTAP